MHARSWVRPTLIAGGVSALALGLAACMGMGAKPQTAGACTDFTFPVYFESGSDQLTTEAVQLIGVSVTRTKGCPTAMMSISGLGQDKTGLGVRRADAVTKALMANGVTAPPRIVPPAAAPGLGLLHRSIDVSVHYVSGP